MIAAGGCGRRGQAVNALDGWRQPLVGRASEAASYKEWMHFCVRLPGDPAGHLLVNFNVTERRLPAGPVRNARLITMVEHERWRGAVDDMGPADLSGAPGAVDVRMGRTFLRWREDAFQLSAETEAFSAQLSLRPLALPTVTSSVSFGPGHAMHWVVIPRLEASGWVSVGGRRLLLERAPAYHDHNWGHFRWGGDLSWEWGFVHPREPSSRWSVVFVRVSDGCRHRTLSQGVLLWRDDVNVRTFQNREIAVTLEGLHDSERAPTFPPVASLLAPGAASGVPARLTLAARGLGDHLDLTFRTSSKARLAVPSDVDDFGLVLLNETAGEARVRGRVRAGAFDFGGPAMVEFVRG